MKPKTDKYAKSGVNYQALDPIKKLAQISAMRTGKYLKKHGYSEVTQSRGESAFMWKQGNIHMVSVIEGLGTKNLVADEMEKIFPDGSYYKVIGYDTVATIINDLISLGATPLVIHAYWAVGGDLWFKNKKRVYDLVSGWESACNTANVTWGGGETPSLKGIINEGTIELGGSAVGIIKDKKKIIVSDNLKMGDRIIFVKSNGINCNGLSLARSLAKKLKKSFATKVNDNYTFGDLLLTKTHIYSKLLSDLQNADVDIHYISNITGHGLRKLMRARQKFTYVVENIFEPQEVFQFIQKQSKLSDEEMYSTFNMGQDFAIFIDNKDVKKTLAVIKKNKFDGLDAGYVKNGPRQVVIKPKNIIFTAQSLDLR